MLASKAANFAGLESLDNAAAVQKTAALYCQQLLPPYF